MRDRRLRRTIDRAGLPEIIWTESEAPKPATVVRAAE
jgi:hypothetical protein